MLTQVRRELALLPPTDPLREQGTPDEREQEERRRQLIEMLAEIEKRINEENARPKKRYISPATREEVYALYYDQLRRKIEDRGTRNFPENQGKKLYGELTMIITVDADGRVRRNRDRARLGQKMLDRRAVAIVHAAGAVRPLHAGDAEAGRPAGDPVALPLHARGRPRDDVGSGRVMSARPRSRYAVVGNPVAHSQSPFIHAAFAAQTGEPVVYERLLCPLDGFAPAVRDFAAGGASGCNVTMPFKFEAFALVARRRARARLAGACNTLRFDADGWLGDNTDGAGLVRDIERNAGVAPARRARPPDRRRRRRGGRARPAARERRARGRRRQPQRRARARSGRAPPLGARRARRPRVSRRAARFLRRRLRRRRQRQREQRQRRAGAGRGQRPAAGRRSRST